MPTRADLIRKAFLDSVKTAVLIDDRFPTYESLVGRIADITKRDTSALEAVAPVEAVAPPEPKAKTQAEPEAKVTPTATDHFSATFKEAGRASSLWKAFRERGWNCDIDDGTGIDVEYAKFAEADLIVLDYELKHSDPTPALNFLRKLSFSDHASLAIVYTNNNELKNVRLTVAMNLRGHLPVSEGGALTEIDDALDSLSCKVDADCILSMLRGQSAMSSAFAKAVIKEIPKGPLKPAEIVDRELERFLRDTAQVKETTNGLPRPFAVDKGTSDGDPLWVLCNNLFVAFVAKEDPGTSDPSGEGQRVIKELDRALENWNPDGLTLTLGFSRGLIARGGFRAAANALDYPLRNASFLYFANFADPTERVGNVKQLYRRILGRFAEHLLDEVADFGSQVIDGPTDEQLADQESLAKWSMEQCGCAKYTTVQLLHELNMFLSTEPFTAFTKLGTVFRVGQGSDSQFWMCATPACDMVPRQPSEDRWEGKLDPIRPAIFIRGERITQLQGALEDAELGRAIFVSLVEDKAQDERRVIRFVQEKGTPVLEHFFLDARGRIDGGRVKAYRSVKLDERIVLQEESLEVVAQVREIYANRFLRSVGEHLSRIGVDFVKFVGKPK